MPKTGLMTLSRTVLFLFLAGALLFPKLNALLIELHPHVRTVVICTGSELVTLKIGPSGQPIEAEAASHAPCLVGTAPATGCQAFTWARIRHATQARFVAITSGLSHHHAVLARVEGRSPPQGRV